MPDRKRIMTITDFYDKFYVEAVKSRAHALFCERVYGINLCQHGMADENQIILMIEALNVGKTSKLLDIGCGPGLITDYIQKKIGCAVTGIDISTEAIRRAIRIPNKNLQFIAGDIANYEFADDMFDAILLIDTHYFIEEFTNSIPKLLKMLKAKGKIAVFSDEGKGEDGVDDSKTKPQETLIGKYLIKNALKYKCIPLCKENADHWRIKKQALLDLEGEFIAENNQFIYSNRLDECNDHDRNLDGRYLFIIDK